MNNKTLPYWLAVEESKTVRFSELAHMMAKAIHPGDDELMSYAAARINLETELKQAVKDGALTVRNAAGLGRHTFPHGDALQRAVLIPSLDLGPFLNARGIELRLTPHGSGPDYWTLENAAAAIAEQEQWHDGTRAEFQDQLQQAAATGAMVILDPRTCLPIHSEQARTYWELVTPESVNNWLEKQAAPYRWNVARPEVKPEPQATTPSPAPVAHSASIDTTPDPERRLALLRALGGSARYQGGVWRFNGIVALEASEQKEGRPRSSQKTIREDLRQAAESEREAKRAGFGSGLGQR
jgi:hypothetical protein